MSALLWFSAAVVLLIVELATGTLFCLALAISFALTALLAVFVQSALWQTCFLAAASTASCLAFSLMKKRRSHTAILGNNLDMGRIVHVEAWENGRTRVQYRGAMWDAVIKEGHAPSPGRFRIAGFDSTTLILEPES